MSKKSKNIEKINKEVAENYVFAEFIAKALKNDEKKTNLDKVKIRRKELITTLVNYLDIKLPKYTVDSTISVHSPDKCHLVEISEDCEETIVRIKHVRDVEHV